MCAAFVLYCTCLFLHNFVYYHIHTQVYHNNILFGKVYGAEENRPKMEEDRQKDSKALHLDAGMYKLSMYLYVLTVRQHLFSILCRH